MGGIGRGVASCGWRAGAGPQGDSLPVALAYPPLYPAGLLSLRSYTPLPSSRAPKRTVNMSKPGDFPCQFVQELGRAWGVPAPPRYFRCMRPDP